MRNFGSKENRDESFLFCLVVNLGTVNRLAPESGYPEKWVPCFVSGTKIHRRLAAPEGGGGGAVV